MLRACHDLCIGERSQPRRLFYFRKIALSKIFPGVPQLFFIAHKYLSINIMDYYFIIFIQT